MTSGFVYRRVLLVGQMYFPVPRELLPSVPRLQQRELRVIASASPQSAQTLMHFAVEALQAHWLPGLHAAEIKHTVVDFVLTPLSANKSLGLLPNNRLVRPIRPSPPFLLLFL